MGSVKDLVIGEGLGANLYQEPTFDRFGLGVWRVSGRFSVADLKHLIPDVEIPGKAQALAMISGRYWEHAASVGFPSTYVGMLDANGCITDTQTLLDSGELSNHIVMKLAMTPHLLASGGEQKRALYQIFINKGKIYVYIADVECIFRLGFPLGSSTFKKIAVAAGVGDEYERVSRLSETIQFLEAIRSIPGIYDKPEMVKALQAAGLEEIPVPGFMIPKPVLNFDTKFDTGGDKPYTEEEAQAALGLGNFNWQGWKHTLAGNALDQRDFCKARGIVCIDGKTEAAVVHGIPIFADFACNPDENRLMIPSDGILLPTNKEVQRAIFRSKGIYAAIDETKKRHGDNWREHLHEFIDLGTISEAANISVELMQPSIAEIANRLLEQTVFEVPPIVKWAGPFLPYASMDLS